MSLRRRKKRIKNQKKSCKRQKTEMEMCCRPSAQKRSKLSGFSPFFSNQTRETRLTSRINLPSELERKWFGQIFGPLDLFFCVIAWFPLFFEDDLSYLNSSGKRLKGSAIFKGFTNKFSIYCVTSWIIGRDFQWKKKKGSDRISLKPIQSARIVL